MQKLLFVCVISSSFILQAICQQWSISQLIPPNYDTKKVPAIDGFANVNISMVINELSAVTESDQSFQLDFKLILKWIDLRLNTNFTDFRVLILDQSYVSKLWIPDIYFPNAVSSSVMNAFQSLQYLTIESNNSFTYTARITGKFSCKMDLSNYPQDFQFCTVQIASLTNPDKILKFFWDQFSVQNLDSAKFRIKQVSSGKCIKETAGERFSCISGTLKLVRRVSYYMIRIYGPSFLCTIAAFVGFWIPILGWPARVAIVLTPLLSLITIDINLNNDINVYYVVAIHWWMMLCHFFIYLALIEYAVAISWAHFINEKKAMRAMTEGKGNIDIERLKGHYFGNKTWFHRSGRTVDKVLVLCFGPIDYTKDPLSRSKVDYVSRILFPLLYVLSILIYIFASVCPWAVEYNN